MRERRDAERATPSCEEVGAEAAINRSLQLAIASCESGGGPFGAGIVRH